MKRIALYLIFISLFYISASAQTDQTAPCSAITITGPASVVAPGETMTFTANITTENSLSYNWSVSAGIITEGQNSPVIKIATTPEMANSGVTATVEVKGLANDCVKTASETAFIVGCGLPIDLDDYEKILFRDEKARLANVVVRLMEQPETSALFVIYFPKNRNSQLKNYAEKISNYLTQTLKIPKERFAMIFGESEAQRTKIIIVPNDVLNTVIKSEEENIKTN